MSDMKELFKKRTDEDLQAGTPIFHQFGAKRLCSTDSLGHARPRGLSPKELVTHISEGVVPLWERGCVLRWRFNRESLAFFEAPDAVKDYVRGLLAEALLKWGSAAPIRFREQDDVYDFEIVVANATNCNIFGCTLARAFFPDTGRHDLTLFPTMFDQSRKEQVDTLIHETGHIFGLRHFFAKVEESAWPSEIFGEHNAFSIMNYGDASELTETDLADLTKLYQGAWSGELEHINGTPVQVYKPYHYHVGADG